MFGINKNGTKHKIGIIMPAFFPSSRVTHESVSVTADGVKTYSALLDQLIGAIDTNKLCPRSILVLNGHIGFPKKLNTNDWEFSSVAAYVGHLYVNTWVAKTSGSELVASDTTANSTSFNDFSSTIPTSGTKITLYYD